MIDDTSNQILLKYLQKGDEQAFEKLYRQHREALYHRVYKLIKSHELAEEIVQDVFVKVWLNHRDIVPSQDFSTYLRVIARNTVYDYFRRIASDQGKIEQMILLVKNYVAASVESQLAHQEMQAHLDSILQKMPEKCREVYTLCKLEGRSYDEVAKLLNISKATVNNHIVKASRIVKANWKDEYFLFFLFFLFE